MAGQTFVVEMLCVGIQLVQSCTGSSVGAVLVHCSQHLRVVHVHIKKGFSASQLRADLWLQAEGVIS